MLYVIPSAAMDGYRWKVSQERVDKPDSLAAWLKSVRLCPLSWNLGESNRSSRFQTKQIDGLMILRRGPTESHVDQRIAAAVLKIGVFEP